jgi:hypothetical protein
MCKTLLSFTASSVKALLVSLTIAALAARDADATAPTRVAIDVGNFVECRDVTPPGFAAAHAQEKIVEAKVRISTQLVSGREQDLEQLQIAIDSPGLRLRVADFQPCTELASEMAGDVEVCATDDTVHSLNASLGGVVSGDHGPAHVQVSPAAGVGVTQNRGSKETYHRLSPKQAVVASGTMNAEHGVFFKWRRTSQVTLEGAREVTCRFVVPRDWRGDWVAINCQMLARYHNYFGDKIEPCGQSVLFAGLYLSGSATAEDAARALASAQMLAGSSGESPVAQGPKWHTVNKPVASGADWFAMPPLFKLCNHEREATPTTSEGVAARQDVALALEALRELSGASPSEK